MLGDNHLRLVIFGSRRANSDIAAPRSRAVANQDATLCIKHELADLGLARTGHKTLAWREERGQAHHQ